MKAALGCLVALFWLAWVGLIGTLILLAIRWLLHHA